VYAKHGNLVNADAYGAKASTKHLESRLEVIQGHTFWDRWKADEDWVLLYNNVGFIRVGNFEGKIWASPFIPRGATQNAVMPQYVVCPSLRLWRLGTVIT